MDISVISTLNTCFWVCLAFTALFFIISIALFFVFDIRTIFNIKTGRAQAKTVKEMKAANERTGRLRVDGKTQTSKLSEKEKEAGRALAVSPPEPQPQNQYNSGSEDTDVLSQTISTNSEYGNLDYAETSVLSDNMTDEFNQSNSSATADKIYFKVVKKELIIHTNEIIQ